MVIPPPAKVALVPIRFMVLPVSVRVRLVMVVASQTVPVPVKLNVLFVPVKVLAVEPLTLNLPVVTVLAFVFSVPDVSVMVLIGLSVVLSCNVHPPPEPLKVRSLDSVTPAVVMVLPAVVALKVIGPVYVHPIPATSVSPPELVHAAEPANLGDPVAGFATVMVAVVAAVSNVTVYELALEEPSKWTMFAVVGGR